MMQKDAKIYVAGHAGLVGSALMRTLHARGYTNLVTCTYAQLDLRNQAAVDAFFAREKPEYVFLAAAKVGGILANATYPASFLYDNVMIALNVMHGAYMHEVKKLLFLGSSCIYPRNCAQPIKEEYLLTSELEKTNEPYAVAKITGLKMCQSYNRQYGTNFIACMPTNLYGPHDNFDINNSHVLPALMRKIYTAHVLGHPTVVLWGTGAPHREFLYVDDLADALLFLMDTYTGDEIINIGTGTDITIVQAAQMIKQVIGYTGDFVFDTSKPDGTPRKLLDVGRLQALGWQAPTALYDGVVKTIAWCRQESIFEQNVEYNVNNDRRLNA
jgi:GDP-L-fucose synthase